MVFLHLVVGKTSNKHLVQARADEAMTTGNNNAAYVVFKAASVKL